MKKIIIHVIAAIVLIAIGFVACLVLVPRTVDIENKCESCSDQVNEAWNNCEDKFQDALLEREIQCQNWDVCDCTDNVTIIESNCDTTELEAELEEALDILSDCADNTQELSIQLTNCIYSK